MRTWLIPGLSCLLVISACSDRTSNADGTGTEGTGDATNTMTNPTNPTDPTGPTGTESSETGPPPIGPAAVDILFVVDNSGSMGQKQGKLAQSIAALVDPLESAQIDYRVGMTTTDNGNPWCTGTSPEGGAFRLTSCRQRLSEFVFEGTTPATDMQDEACLDVCGLDDIQVTGTSPWVENIGGTTNLPADVSMAEALACFLPQGINGCGFESHLESMYKGLNRAQNENEDNFGFIRPDAHLAIVIVSDEVDCSYDIDKQQIFLPPPEGNQVFWTDTQAQFPTSGVCWNAGVSCTGGPGTYDDCVSENYDLDGNPGTADNDAVLRPLSRFINLLQGFEDEKQQLSGASVIVGAIVGVPDGYASGSAELEYQDSVDPQFQVDFGIGPGCTGAGSGSEWGLPPVRMREVAEAFEISGARNLYSVCSAGYDNALGSIAQTILSLVE